MLLPKRIWKEIPGFEGKYQVSNTGQVRSLNYNGTDQTKILKPNTNTSGYKQVNLYKNGKLIPYLVHRLVAQTFIDNPNNLPQVNHKDENKTNNAVWNLEWCDQKYNMNYGTRMERQSKAMKGHKVTKETREKISKNHADLKGKNNPIAKAVLMFTLDGQFIKRFDCVADANEYLDKNRRSTNITMCARGIYKTAWGYKWIYEENYIKEQ